MGAIGFRRGVLLKKVNASGTVNLVGNLLPNWTGTPVVPTINVGVAGSYALPVTGATMVTWKAPGAKPSWITFSGSLMSWSNAAVAGSFSGVVLTATNAGGSVDSNSFGITVISTIPAWTAVPSPVIIEGQSGSYTLPVSNATSVTWAGSVAKPAWLTLVAATPPRLTWTAAPAAATIDPTCELIAVGPGGSVPSGKFGLVVGAATGFFAGYTVAKRPLTTNQGNNDNGIVRNTKQTVWSEHPSGRIWGPFGGDYPNNFDMWQWSLNPTTWAAGATNQPTGWRLEQAFPVGLGYPYISRTDCQQIAWDSKRKLWWHVGGYNENVPVDAYAFRLQVAKFDPSQPINQRWSSTGVPYQTDVYGRQASEKGGPAVYDPLTDCVYAHWGWGPRGNVAIWNCATQAWLGFLRFNDIFEIDDDTYTTNVVGIDPERRLLYIQSTRSVSADFASPVTQQFRSLYKVALPSSAASLPAAGVSVNYSANCTKVWDNAGRTTTLIVTGGSAHIQRDGRNLQYTWIRGPYSTVFESGEPATKYGRCGHPLKGNGTYGSANTGILVDLDTGAEEYTQLPHLTYEDGQGWVIPNIAIWSEKYAALLYMTADTEDGAGLPYKIENNCAIVREATPDWLSPLPLYQWYALPNSTPETALPSSVRAIWSGAEPAGANCELDANKSPWSYSGMAFRQRGAIAMFHGGGGGDGRANGVLAFRANANTTDSDYGWTVAMKPTPRSKTITAWTGVGDPAPFRYAYNHLSGPDYLTESTPRTPVAVHAYLSATFFDSEDLWVRFGAQMTHPTDQTPLNSTSAQVHGFKWDGVTMKTEDHWILDAKPAFNYNGEGGGGRRTIKNPWNEHVLVGTTSDYRWQYFNKDKGTWRNNCQDVAAVGVKVPVAFDPNWNAVIFVDEAGGIPSAMDFSASDTPTLITGSAASWGGPDGAAFNGKTDAPWTWDEENVCWWGLKAIDRSSPNPPGTTPQDSDWDLWKIVPVSKAGLTFTVTKVTTTGSKPVWSTTGQGIGNRFQWSAELGGIVVSLGYRAPIHFIKTSTKG